jgi:hypothetical protein
MVLFLYGIYKNVSDRRGVHVCDFGGGVNNPSKVVAVIQLPGRRLSVQRGHEMAPIRTIRWYEHPLL